MCGHCLNVWDIVPMSRTLSYILGHIVPISVKLSQCLGHCPNIYAIFPMSGTLSQCLGLHQPNVFTIVQNRPYGSCLPASRFGPIEKCHWANIRRTCWTNVPWCIKVIPKPTPSPDDDFPKNVMTMSLSLRCTCATDHRSPHLTHFVNSSSICWALSTRIQ